MPAPLKIPKPDPLNPASLLHFAVRTAIVMSGGTRNIVSLTAEERSQKLRYDAKDPQPIARDTLLAVERDLRSVGFVSDSWRRISDFATTYLPESATGIGLERVSSKYFEGLVLAGDARSRDEALVRLHACRGWLQDHVGPIPKDLGSKITHTIHDAFTLTELPADGSHEATIALAALGADAIREVKLFVSSDPIAFRLIRVATTALGWATKQPAASPFRTVKQRADVLGECKLLIEKLDDSRVHCLYPARSLAAELASFAPADDPEWIDWLVPMLKRQAIRGLPNAGEDGDEFQPLPVRTRAFLGWVVYSLVARANGYDYADPSGKPSTLAAFKPVRELQKALERDPDPGIQYAAAYLKHVLAGGSRSFDSDNISGFWAKQPAVTFVREQVEQNVDGFAGKYLSGLALPDSSTHNVREGIKRLCEFALVSIHGSDRRRVLEALAASGASEYSAEVFARIANGIASDSALRREFGWLLDHACFALGYQRAPRTVLALIDLANQGFLSEDTRITCLMGAGDTAHDSHWLAPDLVEDIARQLIKLEAKPSLTLSERRALTYAIACVRSPDVMPVLTKLRNGDSHGGLDWVTSTLAQWGLDRATNLEARKSFKVVGARRLVSAAAALRTAADRIGSPKDWPRPCTDLVNPTPEELGLT